MLLFFPCCRGAHLFICSHPCGKVGSQLFNSGMYFSENAIKQTGMRRRHSGLHTLLLLTVRFDGKALLRIQCCEKVLQRMMNSFIWGGKIYPNRPDPVWKKYPIPSYCGARGGVQPGQVKSRPQG